jgi:hypothetical protein
MRSKTEQRYADMLGWMKKAGEIVDFEYESESFKIGVDRSYTPDFVVEYSGKFEIVEIKGFPAIKQYGKRSLVAEGVIREFGIFKFRSAAFQYQDDYFRKAWSTKKPIYWRLVEWKHEQWETMVLIHNGEKAKEVRKNGKRRSEGNPKKVRA